VGRGASIAALSHTAENRQWQEKQRAVEKNELRLQMNLLSLTKFRENPPYPFLTVISVSKV
jgi:hypothetical protein